MVQKKLVSVVIPTYNRQDSVIRAVKSVLAQTYKPLEVIIVDDCSTDNTVEMVKTAFESNSSVVFYRQEKNSGACAARNKGVQISKGEYVAFLDSDDEYLPEKLSKQIALLNMRNADLCATDYIRIDKQKKKTIVPTFKPDDEDFFSKLLYLNQVTTGTLIGKRQCFVDTPFDESLPRYQDWDIVIRLAQKYHFCFLKEQTIVQYFQPVSITNSTSHHKTFMALSIIYEKNREAYHDSKKGYSQIMWLLGLHSVYNKNDRNVSALWKGVVVNGFKFHRFLIFILVLLGNRSIIDKNL